MDFNNFGMARDLFYLTFILLGVAFGIYLTTKNPNTRPSQRTIRITISLCFISFAVAALAASIIASAGRVFTVPSFYFFAFIFFGMSALAIYYPRKGGYAALIVSAVFILWISFSFLVFPQIEKPEELSLRSGDKDQILVQWEYSGRDLNKLANKPGLYNDVWIIQEDGRPVTFEAVALTAYRGYPLIGGQRRGIITRVTRRGELLFKLSGKAYRFSIVNSPAFIRERYTLDLPPGALRAGIGLFVLFDGQRLYFHPPIMQ